MCKNKVITIIIAASMMLTLVSCSTNSNSGSNFKSASASVDSIKKDTEVSDSISNKTSTKTTDEVATSTDIRVTDDEKKKSENNYYILDQKDITIYLPKKWGKYILPDGSYAYILERGKSTNVNLVVESTQGLDENAYVLAVSKDLELNGGAMNLTIGFETKNGAKFLVDEYDAKVDGVEFHTYQITIIRNETAYILTIGGKSEDKAGAKEALWDVVNNIDYKN